MVRSLPSGAGPAPVAGFQAYEGTEVYHGEAAVQARPLRRLPAGGARVQWLAGNADGLAKLINAQETDPLIYKRLITDRNANWAKWIDKRLEQPGTVFIAVGAGHLAGKGSVQDQLKKLRIKSARVR